MCSYCCRQVAVGSTSEGSCVIMSEQGCIIDTALAQSFLCQQHCLHVFLPQGKSNTKKTTGELQEVQQPAALFMGFKELLE